MKTMTSTQYFSTKRRWLARSAAALFAAATALTALPQQAHAGVFIGVGISVGFPPPVLPVYVQPVIPAPGYIWTPGYWAWNGVEYYWVPGTWVLPPFYGALWTPGYWGWAGGVYAFHAGYWGTHVGFYGGVNYGFGYTGVGYLGGHWGAGGFYYNRSVNQFGGVHVTNVYNQTIVHNTFINRTSYNGGQGGLSARATPQQMAFARDPHNVGPIAAQQTQMRAASQNRAMFASVNHGSPAIAATQRPGVFNGAGVMAARGAAAPGAAAGRFTPAAANVQHVNNNMALRSASYAPHANTAARPASVNRSAYHPSTVNRGNYSAHTASSYRPAASSYRAAPSYHAAPQYHAAQSYHPAAAPRGGGGGRPSGGGGHDSRHG
ncbi:YXWGXW repeat-containing protein [Dyella acidiphila]|uniref:YXWGXW repeat-containing protein n=1 Tax=Dyella acidiphila TaxID=2775866 RepID=A0ABR9G720_9GAMM|nr:YXWGXW repeat-containing protein [Dyella acidiphila]MBE1159808.1 YXWGXW repeat-containing protein [Dyella acidiphila]